MLSALLGWINHRFLKLPSTVALTMMGALASVVVIAVDRLLPQSDLAGIVGGFLEGIDFHETLMEGMLSFLLFAGALHVDIDQLRRGRWQIALLSTIGVVASTLLIGGGFWLLTGWMGLGVPLIWCLVFGALLGLVVGWIGFQAMKAIDDYAVEVLISLAVVMGGYSLASGLHISGPVAMAVAGLLIGNHGVAHAMSDVTQDYLLKFWALLDEVLKAVLFLLIGLEAVFLAERLGLLGLGVITIPLVLAARAAAVGLPLLAWRNLLPFGLAFPVMTWGGLRGGISIALALSLPAGPMKDVLLAATYVVVLFSVLAQGGTIGGLVRRLNPPNGKPPEIA